MTNVDLWSDLVDAAEPKMTVPALRGRLGGVDYFVITLPFNTLARYVAPTDPNIEDPRMRENRKASPLRFRDIAKYILLNPTSYRLSALTCTFGKNGTREPINWQPARPDGPANTIGLLTLSQRDPLVIVDGQHRLGAIQAAIDEDPSLQDESIAIVLFPYIGTAQAQQLFSDLNRNARKTTKSLDILFDHRDLTNQVVQNIVESVSFLGERVNLEDVSVPLNSSKVFTLAGIYQATQPIESALESNGSLPKLTQENVQQHADVLVEIWEFLGAQFPEWGEVAEGTLDIRAVRSKFLHWNSGVLSAIGEFTGLAIREWPGEWQTRVEQALQDPVNDRWQRASGHWQGIATAGGSVLPRSSLRVALTAYLRKLAGMSLSAEESSMLGKGGN